MTALVGARGAGLPVSRDVGQRSRGTGASTSSLAKALLDDATLVPSDAAITKSGTSHQRHTKQLILLQDSAVQSSTGLVREIIARSTHRNQPVLLVTTLRRPRTYLDGTVDASATQPNRIHVIDANELGNVYEPSSSSSIRTCQQLASKVVSAIHEIGPTAKLTIIVDSLEAIAAQAKEKADGIRQTCWFVREVLSTMSGFSRLIVGLPAEGANALEASLHSAWIWGPSQLSSSSSSPSTPSLSTSTGTVMTVKLHPPALLRNIFKNYGLKPPSTSTAVFKALQSTDDGTIEAPTEQEDADPRFWDILRNISSRGPFGIPNFVPGGGTSGWWSSEEACQFEPLSALASTNAEQHRRSKQPQVSMAESISASTSSIITLADLLDVSKTGYIVLDLHYQARNGKVHEELVALVSTPSASGRFVLAPLDLTDHRQMTPSSPVTTATSNNVSTSASGSSSTSSVAAPATNSHASMMNRLPFNLSETEDQRQRRETVPLPYAYYQTSASNLQSGSDATQSTQAVRGSTGNATIFFEPEQDDDEDDEDPDDDLDL